MGFQCEESLPTRGILVAGQALSQFGKPLCNNQAIKFLPQGFVRLIHPLFPVGLRRKSFVSPSAQHRRAND